MVDCDACDGKGLNPENYAEYCSKCEGSGHMVEGLEEAGDTEPAKDKATDRPEDEFADDPGPKSRTK